MREKTVSSFFLLLLILNLSASAFLAARAHYVGADVAGTSYLNADGSVSLTKAPISRADNVTYTLTGNVIGSIVVSARDYIIKPLQP